MNFERSNSNVPIPKGFDKHLKTRTSDNSVIIKLKSDGMDSKKHLREHNLCFNFLQPIIFHPNKCQGKLEWS